MGWKLAWMIGARGWYLPHAIDEPVVQFFLEDAWEKWKLS